MLTVELFAFLISIGLFDLFIGQLLFLPNKASRTIYVSLSLQTRLFCLFLPLLVLYCFSGFTILFLYAVGYGFLLSLVLRGSFFVIRLIAFLPSKLWYLYSDWRRQKMFDYYTNRPENIKRRERRKQREGRKQRE